MSRPKLDGYRITREIAAGGMARIYDATQISLNRPVAIKFLSKSLLDHHEAISLFEHESMVIAKLNHTNIVQVIDKGITEDFQPYFVMEKIDGINLTEIIAQAELSFTKKIDIAIQSCKGLSYAHKNNVIHRDIKPANIVIDNHGNAKIFDFCIALSEPDNKSANNSSSVVGTIGYIAPEQKNNYANATIASDIFSFGMLLRNLFSIKEYGCKGSSEKDKLPELLLHLVKKCTSKEPSKRFDSLNDVRDILLEISQGSHLAKAKRFEAQQDTKNLSVKFTLLDVLGKTRRKRIYLFQKRSNNQLIVIKRQLGDSKGLKRARILSSLRHPNIVQVLATVKSGGNFILISEYLPGGSLAHQMLQDTTEQAFLTQACQICSAIHFAHQNNIQHSNLSTENILFDARMNIKLSDFGQTREPIEGEELRKKYHPPGQQAYSEQYDIYCMGAIFYHMLFGVPLGEKIPVNTTKYSFRLQQLIDKMLAIDPINRPTTAQQVLLELQKIARSKSVRPKSSSIALNRNTENKKDKKRKKKHAQQHQAEKKEQGKPIILTIAFVISLSLVIFLIVNYNHP